jgi:hypothetical protein
VVPQADAVVLLLKDISGLRMDKVRRNIHQLSPSTLALRLGNMVLIDVTNVRLVEMHAVWPFVMEAFRLHRELLGRGSLYNHGAVVGLDNATGGNSLLSLSRGGSVGGCGGGRTAAGHLHPCGLP